MLRSCGRPAALALAAGSCLLALGGSAHAVEFDARGEASLDEARAFSQSFEAADAVELGIRCDAPCTWQRQDRASSGELPLEGEAFVSLNTLRTPFEVALALPASDESYRVRIWVRHGRIIARAVFEFSGERGTEAAYMFPSGRVTSDGWVELESNPVSVTASLEPRALIRIEGGAVDIDALEIVPEGIYEPGAACLGAFDARCGPEAVCLSERCRQGARFVPPLPPLGDRKTTADYLASRIRYLFGGKLTRARNLSAALARMEEMQNASTPWQYWSALAHGIRLLRDWHTTARSGIEIHNSARRFGVCFVEGRADLSQTTWPSTPGRADVLVSHVGVENTLGLHPGDRLVAVDGQHPIEWARSLSGANWGYHVATDPDVDAELVESMRGLLATFARNFSVIRCDSATRSCSDVVETIEVTSIPIGGSTPACDNRPTYHLENPPEQQPGSITTLHQLPLVPWLDRVSGSPAGEDIYGMTFDGLYGLASILLEDNEFLRQNARGVILDHRAGNGGTVDSPQAITQLVRTPFDLSVGPSFMAIAGDDGPATQADGLLLFERYKAYPTELYRVGSDNPDTALPVALLIDRDGSASDWLPHGMKGAPKVRIFGPHETAGAFSSFYQFSYWSRFEFRIASGDTISFEGEPLVGSGIAPDEIVEHTQAALLQGRDLPFEAAIAWVRGNLK